MALKCSNADLDNAIQRYINGEPLRHIFPTIKGLSEKRLSDTIRERGLLRPRSEWGQRAQRTERLLKHGVTPHELARRYEGGESVKALSQTMGIERSTIIRFLQDANIPIRGKSEGMFLRMAQTSPEERLQLTEAAHEANRGRVRSIKERTNAAQTRQARRSCDSPEERRMIDMLKDAGIETIPQIAIGTYNCDIGAAPVAVEVFGGNWHGYGYHKTRTPKRSRYILDQGWSMLIVWVDPNKFPLSPLAADYAITLIQEARRDPSLVGKYWVIRGDGKEIAAGETDVKHLAHIPTAARS